MQLLASTFYYHWSSNLKRQGDYEKKLEVKIGKIIIEKIESWKKTDQNIFLKKSVWFQKPEIKKSNRTEPKGAHQKVQKNPKKQYNFHF
jgi:hypothetical protein